MRVFVLSIVACVVVGCVEAPTTTESQANELVAAAKVQATANCDAACLLKAIIESLDPAEDAALIELLELVVILHEQELETFESSETLSEEVPATSSDRSSAVSSAERTSASSPLSAASISGCPPLEKSGAQQRVFWGLSALTVEEAQPDGTGKPVPLCLSRPADRDLIVSFAYQDGTAVLGRDYKDSVGSWLIPQGSSGLLIKPLRIKDNNWVTSPVDYTVMLQTTETAWSIGSPAVLEVTVLNDDDLHVRFYKSGPPRVELNRLTNFDIEVLFFADGVLGSVVLEAGAKRIVLPGQQAELETIRPLVQGVSHFLHRSIID